MKSFLFTTGVIALFLVFPFFLSGQNYIEDVVYLKNGSIIHGMIIEQIINQSIKIQTKDNNVFVFKMDEIERIAKEAPSTAKSPSAGKQPTGRLRNSFMGFYAGVDFATLGPKAQNFASELAAGLNSSQGFTSFSCYPHSRTGLTAGWTYNGRITGPLFLQIELAYITRGLVINGTGLYSGGAAPATVTIEERVKLDYMKFPILLKYYFFPKGTRVKQQNNINVYLQAGPSAALAVSRSIKSIVTMNGSGNSKSQDIKDYVKGLDFTLDFGGGIEIYKILTLDFRYDLGLSNIWEDKANEPSALRNRGFSINIGCNFPL